MSVLIPNVLLFLVLGLVIVGAVIAVAGRDRYRPRHKPSASAHPTDEVFIDPESGRRQRVWYDPATGAREYRDDPGPPGG